MRAVGYFREFPQERAEGDSLSRQNETFLEFCRKEGYEPAATFLDTAASLDSRTGFRQMLSYLREPEKGFVVVAVSSVDRLGGNLKEAARSFFEIESLGTQVVVSQGTGDGLADLLQAWSGDGRRGEVGERVRAAMRRKAVRGEVLGRPPYGYAVGPKRRLELVPEEAAIVRYIFRLYMHEGIGVRLISRRLNEEELKTRRGGNWSMVSIRDILRNRAYLGTYNRFGVRVPGSHPALVSPDDFRLVQDRLSARRTARPAMEAGEREPRKPFLLSGLAYCGACGNRMIGVSRRQRWKRRSSGEEMTADYRYYQCESRTNQSLCAYHTRRAEDLELEVCQILNEDRAERPVLRAGNDQAVKAEAEGAVDQIRGRLAQLDRRIEGLLDQTTQGRMTKERLRRDSAALARERMMQEDELTEAEMRVRRQEGNTEREQLRNRALDDVKTRWGFLPDDRRQALFRSLLDRVVVSDDAIRVHLRP